jgi:hypothetical protein
MGSTSIILGEVVTLTSPTEVPSPASTARGGLATLVSSTGGEDAEGPKQRTREGGGSEWELIKILHEGDGNSNKMNTASNTRLRPTTQVCQVHTTIEVLLDLGTNKQPSEQKTHQHA